MARVRRRFGTRAVGHTGTLDPFATGLLVVVLGGATRLARFVESERKTYRAVARLGFATDTDDRTGNAVGPVVDGPWPGRPAIEAEVVNMVGRQLQLPPAYSAKQVEGQRSHRVARRGGTLDLAPVDIEVFAVELLDWEPPWVTFRATVGPGTYLRAMARDLGRRLGCGAHLSELRRESVGRFRVADATPVDALTGAETLIAPADLVPSLPRIEVDPADVARLRNGQRIGSATGSGPAALVSDGTLVAIGEPRDGRWQPLVVLAA